MLANPESLGFLFNPRIENEKGCAEPIFDGLVFMIITIEFIGTIGRRVGARKYILQLKEKATILKLFDTLKAEFPTCKELDVSTLLVLVNGQDISLFNGLQTELKSNDIITLIPIFHGG